MLVRVVSLVLILTLSQSRADVLPAREYRLKAAFLYNFAKFVEWPAKAFSDENSTFVMGILGEDPLGPALQLIRDKTVKGRSLTIRRFEGLQDLGNCHILFIPSSNKKRLRRTLKSLEGSSVLTIGEMEDFTQMGGIINFVIRKNKLRFEINLDAGKRAGLEISSQLLNLADSVVDDRGLERQ